MQLFTEVGSIFFLDFLITVHSFHRITKYPYLKQYSHENNDPHKYCDGWICEYSGLTKATIDKMLTADNEIRDQFAQINNISNLYMLEWYPVLEYWAQDKANLCLPSTVDEFYDFAVIQKYGVPNHDDVYKDACQVVIVSEALKTIDINPEQMRERILDHLRSNRLKHFIKLSGNRWDITRKQASQVGCGYSLRLNRTHYVDHLVCLYGSFRFKRKGKHIVETTKGKPCSNCNYYQTNYTWRCGIRYKHLCVGSLADENQTAQVIKKKCSDSTVIRKPKRMDLNSEKSIPTAYEEGPTELNERIASEKRSLNGFFQLFGSVEARTQSFVEDIAKARSFKYQEKPNGDGCHLCMYTLIASATLLGVAIALGACILFRRN